MKTLVMLLAFAIVFGGCAYFEQQKLAQLELDLAEYEANMRESQNALAYAYGEEDELLADLEDFYNEAYIIAKNAKEAIAERRAQLTK